jgi:hypothetical protein
MFPVDREGKMEIPVFASGGEGPQLSGPGAPFEAALENYPCL